MGYDDVSFSQYEHRCNSAKIIKVYPTTIINYPNDHKNQPGQRVGRSLSYASFISVSWGGVYYVPI